MASHMWSNGINYLTAGLSTGATITPADMVSWTQPYTGSSATATAPYNAWAGYLRCSLNSGMGTYTSSTFESAQTEITGTNYATLGADITGGSHNQTSVSVSTSHIDYVASQSDVSPEWLTMTTNAPYPQYGSIFASTGTRSSSPVLCVFDFGTTYQCTAGTFSITFGTDSVAHTVFAITVS